MAEEAKTDWESYPVGLKVLAVDDDPLCLKVVEQMLKCCNYEVKTAENGREALAKLREKDSQIDLVLSDVYMPDMDGFKLLETIALELDVPVIMMSSNGDTPVVLRGVTHGAVDFLIKPVRIEELRNVWQHVVRRKSHQGHNSRDYSGDDGEVVDGNRADKKRKEPQTQVQHEAEENTSAKKPRVVWSVEMHQQFVNAVNSLGIDKAVPKRILDQMNVEGLTRENVASHLQKYRLYLKRVSGVQVSTGGRSKSLRDSGMEAPAYPSMMLPSHAGTASGGQLLSEGAKEQEDLKLRLQMRQIHNEQQGLPAHGLKEEVAMPGMMNQMPFKAEAGYKSNVAEPSYGPLRQQHSHAGSMTGSLPREDMAGQSLLPVQGSGTYEPGHVAYPPAQGFAPEDMHNITSGDLVYPDPMMQPSIGLHDMHLNPPEYLAQPAVQPFTSTDGQRSGQNEQDMERLLDIFLQPNE